VIIDMGSNPSWYENCVVSRLVTDRPQTELFPWCASSPSSFDIYFDQQITFYYVTKLRDRGGTVVKVLC
jgi:hypothetical protein